MARIFWSDSGRQEVHAAYRAILRDWPVAHEELRLPTRQGETFVVASGSPDAPPLVLLHGGLTTSAMWTRNVPTWSKEFRIFAVDLIGEAGLSAPARPSLGSEAYALWLDDVWRELGLRQAALVGASLGGLLALDFAIRRPKKVASLVLLAPAGVGRVRPGFLLKVAPLLFLGAWGHRKAHALDMGFDAREQATPAGQAFSKFFALVQRHYVNRMAPLPTFSDQQLRTLRIPLLAIVGGRDALLDSDETRHRLETLVSSARVAYLPAAGHGLIDTTDLVCDFLRTCRTM